MIHYILFRFQPGYMNDALFEKYSTAYAEMVEKIPCIRSAQVKKNLVARDANMDLMVEVELESQESLAAYLAHPLHQAISEEINPYVLSRCSFDCAE